MTKNIFIFFFGFCFFWVSCSNPTPPNSAGGSDAASTPSSDGKQIFKQYCVVCHGVNGKLGMNQAKDLTASGLNLEERMTIITNGKGLMTPFGEILTPSEIQKVAEYTFQLK